jgi:hypothetical protein
LHYHDGLEEELTSYNLLYINNYKYVSRIYKEDDMMRLSYSNSKCWK